MVLDRFRQHSPAILLGDLNSHKTDLPLKNMLAGNEAVDAIAEVLGDQDPVNRIDWILTRGLRAVNGGSHKVGPSDHPQYWVELMLESQ